MKQFALLLFFPCVLFAKINSNGDYQFWQKDSITKNIGRDWTFVLSTEARFGDDVSKLYFVYLQAEMDYTITKWLSISPGYRQIYRRVLPTSSRFYPEYSPLLDLFFKTMTGPWKCFMRNRIQYVIFRSNPSHWLYRNLVRVDSPWTFTSFEARPYLSNEFFWRESQGINEDRLTIGAHEKLSRHISTDIFYMARFLKRPSGWVCNNVFGLYFIFKY